jgi:hypothetical protein
MDTIIVPGTKQKVWDARPNVGPVQARDAYTGPAFMTWRAFAEDSGAPWYILSTKYGFISPLLAISNYNVPISAAEADPAFRETLRAQVREFRLDRCDRILVVDLSRFEALVRHALGDSPTPVGLHRILF